MTYYQIIGLQNEVIFDNIPPSIAQSLDKNKNNYKSVFYFNSLYREFRIGTAQSHNKSKITIVTDEKKYINSLGIFRDFLSVCTLFIESFGSILVDAGQQYKKQAIELQHNIVKLNAQNIQAIHPIVPTNALDKNSHEQLKIVSDRINRSVDETAKTLLRIAKNNISMKVEISVFEKLMEKRPRISKEKHKIRNVILGVLEIFFQDFEQKTIGRGFKLGIE